MITVKLFEALETLKLQLSSYFVNFGSPSKLHLQFKK